MERMINLCINALSEIYAEVVTQGADTGDPSVGRRWFRKLVAAQIAINSCMHQLGYGPKDVEREIKNYQRNKR